MTHNTTHTNEPITLSAIAQDCNVTKTDLHLLHPHTACLALHWDQTGVHSQVGCPVVRSPELQT